jgi:DNA polymerase-3 subunit delta'
VLILLSERLDKQLPTIRSRAQLIRFQPLSDNEVEAVLIEQKLVEEPAEAARLAKLGEGSVSRAMDLADPALGQFRASFLQALAARPLRNVPLSKQVADFVDAAGKEASLRRARLRWLMGLAAEFYRELARELSGAAPGGDAMLRQAAQMALNKPGWDLDSVLRAADAALDAPGYVDRNANQALVIDAWLEQLSVTITPAVATAGK